MSLEPSRIDSVVHVVPLDTKPAVTQDEYERRLMSCAVRDQIRKPLEVELEFYDPDNVLSRVETLGMGLRLAVTIGRPDRQQNHDVVVHRVRGLAGRRRTTAGLAYGKFKDTIHYYCRPTKLHLLHKLEFTQRTRRGIRVENTRVSDIVSAIAAAAGFQTLIIEPTGARRFITIRDDETWAQYFARAASELGYEWRAAGETFLFCSETYDAASVMAQVIPSFSVFGGPDVLEWGFDQDLEVPGLDGVEGSGAGKHHLTIKTVATSAGVGPITQVEVIDSTDPASPAPAQTAAQVRTNTHEVAHVPDPEKRESDVARRLRERMQQAWKLDMRVIGNPDVRAGGKIQVSGAGDWIDGAWYVRRVTHEVNERTGYTTHIQEATRRDPRVVAGTAAGAGATHTTFKIGTTSAGTDPVTEVLVQEGSRGLGLEPNE